MLLFYQGVKKTLIGIFYHYDRKKTEIWKFVVEL